MNLENYIKYSAIISGTISDELERGFILHKELSQKIYANLSGFPSILTFYGGDDPEQTELISFIQTPDISYILHSLNQRDTVVYPIDEFLSELAKKYGREHLESIMPNSNYTYAYFSHDFKIIDNNLFRSKELIPSLGYKYNLEEKVDMDVERIMEFFTGLSFLDVDTEEAIDKTIL